MYHDAKNAPDNLTHRDFEVHEEFRLIGLDDVGIGGHTAVTAADILMIQSD